MPLVKSNGIEICFETHGEEGGTPLLFIMGLGGQLVRWPPAFLEQFTRLGYHVTVFDNRDVGHSTHFEAHGAPDFAELMQTLAAGRAPDLPYGLDEMADDAAGLLDALGHEAIHVLGVSMGGMIAQALAIRHPARVKSLVSIMSSPGHPDVPPGRPEVMAQLLKPRPKTRQEAVDRAVETDRMIGSPVFPFEEEVYRARAERAYDRYADPDGVGRQTAAIMAHGDRTPWLQSLDLPALVIHGLEDPLVHPEGGRMTARAIPGAELLEIEGMAHDLPSPVHETIADAVHAMVQRVERVERVERA